MSPISFQGWPRHPQTPPSPAHAGKSEPSALLPELSLLTTSFLSIFSISFLFHLQFLIFPLLTSNTNVLPLSFLLELLCRSALCIPHTCLQRGISFSPCAFFTGSSCTRAAPPLSLVSLTRPAEGEDRRGWVWLHHSLGVGLARLHPPVPQCPHR